MLSYPPKLSNTDSLYAEAFEHLVQLRRALLQVSRNFPAVPVSKPLVSRFSSERNIDPVEFPSAPSSITTFSLN